MPGCGRQQREKASGSFPTDRGRWALALYQLTTIFPVEPRPARKSWASASNTIGDNGDIGVRGTSGVVVFNVLESNGTDGIRLPGQASCRTTR